MKLKEAYKESKKHTTNLQKVGHTKEDFADLLYCYNLLIVGYGSIGNSCAIFYYMRELNEKGFLIPNEIKAIQNDIKKNIKSLEKLIIGWQN